MKRKMPSQSFRKRMKELENVSTRIEAKMVKLEKIIDSLSKNLG